MLTFDEESLTPVVGPDTLDGKEEDDLGLVTAAMLEHKLGITRQHLYWLVEHGHIAPKIDPGPGRVKLFDEDEVREYLEKKATSGDGRSKGKPPKWGD